MEVVYGGKKRDEAKKVLVMIHGRGASARDILSLADHLEADDFALVAPQATNHTWYPYSFLSPPAQNEPWLSSALDGLKGIVDGLMKDGIPSSGIYLLGFSQGACLTLEFAARNATRYGGVIAFTGGLIGDAIDSTNYGGDFGGTPIFSGSSDPDPHVPVARVRESVQLLRDLNAKVVERIYPGLGHTINADELKEANRILTL